MHYLPVCHIVSTIYVCVTLCPLFTCVSLGVHYLPVCHLVSTIYLCVTLCPLFTCVSHCVHCLPVCHVVSTVCLCGCHGDSVTAALVEDTIFCMHGGLSPDLVDLQQVNDHSLTTQLNSLPSFDKYLHSFICDFVTFKDTLYYCCYSYGAVAHFVCVFETIL